VPAVAQAKAEHAEHPKFGVKLVIVIIVAAQIKLFENLSLNGYEAAELVEAVNKDDRGSLYFMIRWAMYELHLFVEADPERRVRMAHAEQRVVTALDLRLCVNGLSSKPAMIQTTWSSSPSASLGTSASSA
jgi:hypothetical protein